MKPWMPSLASVCVALATAGCHSEVDATVTELGALSVPSVVTGRDGGAAAMVGGLMLWTFNDTLMTVNGADGFSYRSATAAWASGASLAIEEPLDVDAAPWQLVPYTDQETAYNRAHGPSDRFALWPDSVVPDGLGGALIFSAYIHLLPGTLNWDRLGTSVARLQVGQTVAARQAGTLFSPPEPSFDAGGVVASGLLHLYACDPAPGAPPGCPVARAPLGQATSHDAWQAWNGSGWSSDLTTGVPVITDVPGELSVSWNVHLGSYLAVHSVPLSNDVVYQTAPSPEGPWSAEHPLFTGRHDGSHTNYAAKEHPELVRDGGRTLVVGYADAAEGFGSRIRLALPTLP